MIIIIEQQEGQTVEDFTKAVNKELKTYAFKTVDVLVKNNQLLAVIRQR